MAVQSVVGFIHHVAGLFQAQTQLLPQRGFVFDKQDAHGGSVWVSWPLNAWAGSLVLFGR